MQGVVQSLQAKVLDWIGREVDCILESTIDTSMVWYILGLQDKL
jgi:hypothetical protein